VKLGQAADISGRTPVGPSLRTLQTWPKSRSKEFDHHFPAQFMTTVQKRLRLFCLKKDYDAQATEARSSARIDRWLMRRASALCIKLALFPFSPSLLGGVRGGGRARVLPPVLPHAPPTQPSPQGGREQSSDT